MNLDNPTPTTPAPPEDKPARRARLPLNQGLIDELNLAEQLVATARKPGYAERLAEEEIDTAFLESLGARIKRADGLVGSASNKKADKQSTTQREESLKNDLLKQIQGIQKRAKRKYQSPADPLRKKYFIAERLGSNRALLERAGRSLLATATTDPLPGLKPVHVAALSLALEAYVNVQTDQTGDQSEAGTDRALLEAETKVIAGLRREIQYAADALWPASDKSNAALRREFGLPATRALR